MFALLLVLYRNIGLIMLSKLLGLLNCIVLNCKMIGVNDSVTIIVIRMYSCTTTGKHRALSLEVTCNFRLYFKIGRTCVKMS